MSHLNQKTEPQVADLAEPTDSVPALTTVTALATRARRRTSTLRSLRTRLAATRLKTSDDGLRPFRIY